MNTSNGLKLVIATCSQPVYHIALRNLLNSLKYMDHLEEIMIVVSGVPDGSEMAIQSFYHSVFGLPVQNILTYPYNGFEYSAFVAVAEIAESLPEAYFAFIHDTTQAGPAFWRDLYAIVEEIAPPKIQATIYDNVYHLTKPLRIEDTYVSELKMVDGILTSTEYQCVFLAPKWQLVLEREDALHFDASDHSIQRLQEIVDSTKDIWYPFADNFNMGIAIRQFLSQCILPNFRNLANLTKHEAIDIELRLDHPLNFKNLAKRKWRYATRQFGKLVSPEPWKNTTDVFGDGVLRCVCGLVVPDIIKFVRLLQ